MSWPIPYFKTDIITLEDVTRTYPEQELLAYQPPAYNGPVLAVGRAVYESMPQQAVDSWTAFCLDIARDFAPGNLWMMPTHPRLTYPYAVYWPLAGAFRIEREQKRRFDYFLWMDDDVLFKKSDVMALLRASQQNDAPFVAALPYDRNGPKSPSIVEKVDGQPFKWVKAPKSGSYPVAMTGFVLCLFRREIFDAVPEPWFGVCAPAKGFSGIAPDWWWSIQMSKVGIQPWVCCDTNVRHLGTNGVADRESSEAFFDSHDATAFGELDDRTLYTSQNTGAIMTKPPTFSDGRGEYEQASNIQ